MSVMERVEVTTYLIMDAIARMIKTKYPGANVYASPEQAGQENDWILQLMPDTEIVKELGNRYRRTVSVDIVHIREPQKLNGNIEYYNDIDTLDWLFAIPVGYYDSDDEQVALLRFKEQSPRINVDSLHYSMSCTIMVAWAPDIKPPDIFMERIQELNMRMEVK
jgi:hypothetical protein